MKVVVKQVDQEIKEKLPRLVHDGKGTIVELLAETETKCRYFAIYRTIGEKFNYLKAGFFLSNFKPNGVYKFTPFNGTIELSNQ